MEDDLGEQPNPTLPLPSDIHQPSNNGASSSSGGNGRLSPLSSLSNGGLAAEINRLSDYFENFPPGYRFSPEDYELILDYLMKRANNQPVPPSNIVDVNIYEHNPETLAQMFREFGKTEWYFFTPREKKYKKGARPKRAASGGYWKATGADKQVHFAGKLIGFRRSLVFYLGKPPEGTKTNWIMQEYRAIDAPPPPSIVGQPKDMRLDDCVLCKIYQRGGGKQQPSQKQKQGEDQPAVVTPKITDETENVDLDGGGKQQHSQNQKQGEDQPAVFTPKIPDEIANVDLELDDGCSIIDSIEDYDLDIFGGDGFGQCFNMDNHIPFQNPTPHLFSQTENLPPLPQSLYISEPYSFVFSQQALRSNLDLRMNSGNMYNYSFSGYENPHFSFQRNFGNYNIPPMRASLQNFGSYNIPPVRASLHYDDLHREGFSANMNHVSSFYAPGFDAPSSSYLLNSSNMETQVDLRAISPLLFRDNENNGTNPPVNISPPTSMANGSHLPPVKKFKHME